MLDPFRLLGQILRCDFSILTEEIADGELEEVEETRNRELLRKESQQIGNKVKEASSTGDAEKALLELERLIAQKRRME